MTKIEENSLNAQIELMKDVIRNYEKICYAVTTKADNLAQYLYSKTVSDDSESVTLNKQEFGDMKDAVRILQNRHRWNELNSVTSDIVTENEIKIKVLLMLQK